MISKPLDIIFICIWDHIFREGFIKKNNGNFPTRRKAPPLQKVGKNIFFIWYIGSKKCFYAKKIFWENFPTFLMNIVIHFPLLMGISIWVSKLEGEGGGVTRHKQNFFVFLHDSELSYKMCISKYQAYFHLVCNEYPIPDWKIPAASLILFIN